MRCFRWRRWWWWLIIVERFIRVIMGRMWGLWFVMIWRWMVSRVLVALLMLRLVVGWWVIVIGDILFVGILWWLMEMIVILITICRDTGWPRTRPAARPSPPC